MCGRYTLTSRDDFEEHFALDSAPEVKARFNIAPSQESLIVTAEAGGNQAHRADWGFTLPAGGRRTTSRLVINARSEDLEKRPLFRDSFATSRCLVPASGFYEWTKIGRIKQPYYFSARDSTLLAFAGLWTEGPEERANYVLLTTAANQVVSPVHHRMPVILSPEDYPVWLERDNPDSARLEALLRPCPAEKLASWPVGMRVNDAAYDDPSCVRPLEGPVDLFMY